MQLYAPGRGIMYTYKAGVKFCSCTDRQVVSIQSCLDVRRTRLITLYKMMTTPCMRFLKSYLKGDIVLLVIVDEI